MIRHLPASFTVATPQDRRPLRFGAVQYLNTRPLVHGLAGAGIELSFDLPSRLADRLTAAQLDVALIPVVELFRHPEHRLVSDACIGCRGAVMSVKLLLRTAPQRVASIALDEGSRTSAVLAQVLLAERHGVRPRVEPLSIGSAASETAADAVLLIGDRALSDATAGGSFQQVWDLGDEWCRWTGLPFVFAAWAARPGVSAERFAGRLEAARDAGLANLAAIAAAEAAPHGLTVPQCLSYLRDNLHYHLGPREQEAVRAFRDLAAGLGLVPLATDSRGPLPCSG
ncbi:MAG: menaquinone biosynthetic enzyme MqnA/MqnD family protein [Planctomycetota bacterium]